MKVYHIPVRPGNNIYEGEKRLGRPMKRWSRQI
jgi:hypothetical protein